MQLTHQDVLAIVGEKELDKAALNKGLEEQKEKLEEQEKKIEELKKQISELSESETT